MCESLSVVMVHLVPHVPVRDRRTEELSVVHRRPRYRLRWNPSQARARVRFCHRFDCRRLFDHVLVGLTPLTAIVTGSMSPLTKAAILVLVMFHIGSCDV